MDISLIPKKIESKSTKFHKNSFMEQGIVLSHPFSLLFVGQSGSGKTNTAVWMLNNMYKKYFHSIIILSPTGKCDLMLASLPEARIITTNLIQETKDLMDKRRTLCERIGVAKVPRLLVIFEDVSSQRKLIASEDFTRAFVALRHYGCSTIAMSHKLKAINRMARINTNGLIIFPSTNSELQQLLDEYTPASTTKKEFIQMIKYAWQPEEHMERPFLFIDFRATIKKRFRKGFHQIMLIKND